MKKKYLAALAAGIGAGAWCVRREKKYPVCRELRFANKLAVPGWAINLKTARLSNRMLDRMARKPPALPQGITRRDTQFFSGDGSPIPLTVYRPEGLEGAAPMLARDLSGLPPAYVEVEEFDCLHDEGAAYARALEAAGVEVHLEDVPGTFHGFDFFTDKEVAKEMAAERTRALREAFHG